MSKRLLFVLWLGLLIAPALCSYAQERSYYYDSIKYDISVNQDSTFDVAEQQTYIFNGEYHQGWRNIPLNKISRISDFEVVDEISGQTLVYSSRKLDKTNPASWGKYTTYRQNGSQIIEWYYNTTNQAHTWTLKYKVHGGLSFLRDKDEIYWNLFTSYDVPIQRVEVRVTLPENNFSAEQLQAAGYGEPVAMATTVIENNKTFFFTAENLPAEEKLTIAAGWPLGLIDRAAFWRQWFASNILYFLAILIALATVIYSFARWWWLEKRPERRRTIVAEYSPPESLKPAMAELIVKEGITSKAWAATVVDLAVRGYLTISEVKNPDKWNQPLLIILPIVFIIFTLVPIGSFTLLAGVALYGVFKGSAWVLLFFLVPLVMAVLIIKKLLSIFTNKENPFVTQNYKLDLIEEINDVALEDYEKKFIEIIFDGNKSVTTERLTERARQGNYSGEESSLSKKMLELQKKLVEETEQDTNAYTVKVSKEIPSAIYFVLIFMAFWTTGFFGGVWWGVLQWRFDLFILIISLAFSCLWVLVMRREARLNDRGIKLKQDWLGFVLYLKTAERYRLQNLTPDLFEKYLPYAIIFGIERKWAKAFEGMTMMPPEWYGGSVGSASAMSTGLAAGSFSASAFSSSFAKSFTSAFASSSGGGASGGGGGAGGGGGGGGGGAS